MYAYVLDGKGPDELTLPDVYSYSPVGGLIPLPKVRMHNTVKVHTWTGADHRSICSEEEKAIGRNGICNCFRNSISQKSGMQISECCFESNFGRGYKICSETVGREILCL